MMTRVVSRISSRDSIDGKSDGTAWKDMAVSWNNRMRKAENATSSDGQLMLSV